MTVGTDHHAFDRLIRWLDEWLGSREAHGVECLVQAGTSAASRRATCRPYLTYPEMEAALTGATAVVCHGGPGTIMMALGAGKKPIVVPRTSALGEHVDEHQVVFTRRLAEAGTIWLAESEDRFRQLLASVVADPQRFASSPALSETSAAVRELERLVDELLDRSGSGRR